MKKAILILISVMIFGGMLILLTACPKPKNPTAKVYVIDEKGEPVEGAMVVVRAPVKDSAHTIIYTPDEDKPIADTSETDRSGEAFFTFKYEAIYRVEVTKYRDRRYPVDRRGLGILILEHNKTAEAKITINEQTVFN